MSNFVWGLPVPGLKRLLTSELLLLVALPLIPLWLRAISPILLPLILLPLKLLRSACRGAGLLLPLKQDLLLPDYCLLPPLLPAQGFQFALLLLDPLSLQLELELKLPHVDLRKLQQIRNCAMIECCCCRCASTSLQGSIGIFRSPIPMIRYCCCRGRTQEQEPKQADKEQRRP